MSRRTEHCVSSLAVGYRAISCGICDEQCGTGTELPLSALIFVPLWAHNSRFLPEDKIKKIPEFPRTL